MSSIITFKTNGDFMKKTILMAMVLVAFATSAQAKREKLYMIDFSGKRFQDNTFNLMDDGISGDFDAYGLKLDGKIGEDFIVKAKASNPQEKCGVTLVKVTGDQTILKLIEDLETDGGETCDLTFIYRDGHKATLSIYEEGT